MNLSRTHHLF